MDFLDARGARAPARRRRAGSRPASRAGPLRPGDGRRADPDRAVVVHAPRPEPRPRPRDRRRLGGLRVGRERAERRTTSTAAGGSATGPTTRTSSGCRQMLNVGPLLRRLPGRADRHPRVGPPPHAIHDLLTLADKPIHAYSPRPPAQPRRARDGAHRPRHRRRDARPRAVDLHGHQLALAAAPRHADAAGHPRVQPRNQVIVMTPFTLAGAMAPVTLAGALAEQNAEALAGMVADPGRPPGRAGRLRRVHVERRHAVGRAGVRDAGVHADRDGRRPAGAALRRAVSLVERVRRQRRRRPGRLRVACSRCGARSWAGSTC